MMGDLLKIDSRYRANEAKIREISSGDCMVNKQDFRASRKLIQRLSHGTRPKDQINRRGRPLSRGQ